MRLDAYKLVERTLREHLQRLDCLGLGEVGLDRLKGAPMPRQMELLKYQLLMAKEMQKPVVVHCVKAWSELFSCMREVNFTANHALHGFRASERILDRLMQKDWYISVGATSNGEVTPLTSMIPEDRLLIESDDRKFPIALIYEKVAQIRGIDLLSLRQQVQRNISTFFSFSHACPVCGI